MKNSLIKQSFLYFALGLVFVYFVIFRVTDYAYDILAYILIIMTLMDFGIGIGLMITGFKRRKKNL
ncbi:YdiK family protein [Listeria welshimeri]|nr:YdiK family protein [Listeria welshimeri]